MKQTWDFVKHNYTFDETEILLNSIRHKDNFRLSTSRKFKKDLIEYFSDEKYRKMTMVELGACQGDTTLIFSKLPHTRFFFYKQHFYKQHSLRFGQKLSNI